MTIVLHVRIFSKRKYVSIYRYVLLDPTNFTVLNYKSKDLQGTKEPIFYIVLIVKFYYSHPSQSPNCFHVHGGNCL